MKMFNISYDGLFSEIIFIVQLCFNLNGIINLETK